jgi:hypothetical protein
MTAGGKGWSVAVVEFPLGDGRSVFIETGEQLAAPDTVGVDEQATRLLQRRQSASEPIVPAGPSLEVAVEAVCPALDGVAGVMHEIASDVMTRPAVSIHRWTVRCPIGTRASPTTLPRVRP